MKLEMGYQIMVIGTEEDVKAIEGFLGVPQADWLAVEGAFAKRNTNSDGIALQINPSIWANLSKFYAPHNLWLERLLGRKFPEWGDPPVPDGVIS